MSSYRLVEYLRRALEQPFGPFEEADTLTEKCKTTPKNPLQLGSLELRATVRGEDRRVGLDMTEAPVIFPWKRTPEEDEALRRLRPVNVLNEPRLPENTPIAFLGALTLMNEKHLQGHVLALVQSELRQRLRRAKAPVSGDPWAELFTENGRALKDERKPRVKILVRGTVGMPAFFHKIPDVGHVLCIASRDRRRKYQVRGMHIGTYTLSRTYLLRYKTLHTIKDIFKEPATQRLSVASRTPQYYIKRYLARHEQQFADILRWRRILGPANTTAPPANAPEPPDEAETHPLGTLARTPRTMRHVHKFEVAHCFGAHVEWLIAQAHAHTQERYFDWSSWLAFAEATYVQREGLLYGRRDEFNGRAPPAGDVRVDLRALLNSRNRFSRESRTTVRANDADTVAYDTTMESDSDTSSDGGEVDSDFYVSSPDERSSDEGDGDDDDGDWPGPSPEMKRVLRPGFFVAPRLSDDFQYSCFIDGCDFHVNLRELTERDRMLLPPEQTKQYYFPDYTSAWRVRQEFLQRALSRIVAEHHTEHLVQLDIKMVPRKGIGLVPEWIHPERHMEWPPQYWVEAREYHENL